MDTVHANHALKSILLRYFNPIGAHSSAAIGELPNGVPNNLVPFVAQTAAGIHKKIKVFGNDYNTPDGTCIRDYIKVMDLAYAHVTAVDRLLNKDLQEPEVYNLGTGKGLSVMELIKTFEAVNGVKVPYEIVGRREGDIEQVWANPSLAQKVLKWKAKASVEETLASAWKWQQRCMERK